VKILARFEEIYDYSSTEEFLESYPDAQLIEVDGKTVLGICAVCDKPCLDGDKYETGSEGDYFCPRCYEAATQDAEAMAVGETAEREYQKSKEQNGN
jgi:hypothetical protein